MIILFAPGLPPTLAPVCHLPAWFRAGCARHSRVGDFERFPQLFGIQVGQAGIGNDAVAPILRIRVGWVGF